MLLHVIPLLLPYLLLLILLPLLLLLLLLLLPLLLYIPYLPYPNCVHVCVWHDMLAHHIASTL